MIKELYINNLSRLAYSSGARFYKQLIYNLRTSVGGGLRRNQFISLTANFRAKTRCADILNML